MEVHFDCLNEKVFQSVALDDHKPDVIYLEFIDRHFSQFPKSLHDAAFIGGNGTRVRLLEAVYAFVSPIRFEFH